MLRLDERYDDLLINGLKIIQSTNHFRFSVDAVLLAHFATIKSKDRVLDLCTGSGVIPLLLSTRDKSTQITGLEIQSEMVDMASRSVQVNELEQQIQILQGDLKELKQILGSAQFELVTVNPPYMPASAGRTNVIDSVTIARHEVMCTLQDVISAAASVLVYKGRLAMVHRANRLAEIIGLCQRADLEPRRLRLIQPRMGQKPNLVLVEAVKGVKPNLEVLENLMIYEGNNYSQEIQAIYGDTAGSQSTKPVEIHWVYIVRCKDGTLYTGYTNHLEGRIQMHNQGKGAKYTRGRRPVTLVYCEQFSDKGQALRREIALKKMNRKSKLALVQHSISE